MNFNEIVLALVPEATTQKACKQTILVLDTARVVKRFSSNFSKLKSTLTEKIQKACPRKKHIDMLKFAPLLADINTGKGYEPERQEAIAGKTPKAKKNDLRIYDNLRNFDPKALTEETLTQQEASNANSINKGTSNRINNVPCLFTTTAIKGKFLDLLTKTATAETESAQKKALTACKRYLSTAIR